MSAAIGTITVALCCFTALLVSVPGVWGFGFVTPYLDYVLLPSMVVLLIVTIMAYRKWRRA
jgi:mercuric ion transport protein